MPQNRLTVFKSMAKWDYDPTAIRSAPDLNLNEAHPSLIQVQNYLKHYGYLTLDIMPAQGQLDGETSNALKRFQRYVKIGESGVLDAPTRTMMSANRCALPDIGGPLNFATIGAWNRYQLTYQFGTLCADVLNNVARDAVRRAFDTWSATGLGLTFTEVNDNPDIFIEWRDAKDPDADMRGPAVAHADYPPGFSIIVSDLPLPLHFDDSEHTWADGAVRDAIDIETTALHEIGHCLGLRHTDVEGSVMSPFVSSNSTLRSLQADDLDGIRNLYPPLLPLPWLLLLC